MHQSFCILSKNTCEVGFVIGWRGNDWPIQTHVLCSGHKIWGAKTHNQIILLLCNADLHNSAKEIVWYLVDSDLVLKYISVTLGSLKITGWGAMHDFIGCQRITGNCLKWNQCHISILLIDLVAIPQGKKCLWTNGVIPPKKIYVSDRN